MNRKRTKQIVIRMTDEEYDLVKAKVEQSGKTQQEFLIRSCTGKKIVVVDGIRELTIELKRIGTNLNQIARAVNQGQLENGVDLSEIEKGLSDVWQLLRQLIQKQV